MKLKAKRNTFTTVSTIGELSVDGVFECFTLEDVVRADGSKVFGQTAIPSGIYKVIVTHSPHFNRDLPLLLNVPGFEGVRIHPGNTDKDTEGCLLVGQTKGKDSIGASVAAFNALFSKIQAAIARGEDITLEIS